jgi:fructose-1,6-bisphosphatase I
LLLLLQGNYLAMPGGVRKFLDWAKTGAKPYSLRYVGSMVADVHRTLLCECWLAVPGARRAWGRNRLL